MKLFSVRKNKWLQSLCWSVLLFSTSFAHIGPKILIFLFCLTKNASFGDGALIVQ